MRNIILAVVVILLSLPSGCRSVSDEMDDEVRIKYKVKFWETVKLLDPDVTDEEAKTTPVRIASEDSGITSGVEVECSTRNHSITFSRENGRIIFFHNSQLVTEIEKEYEKARLENPDKPYEYTPRLTEESFMEIEDFVPNIHILDIEKQLEKYEREEAVYMVSERWLTQYRRVENGYKFEMGAIMFYIDDRTGKLSSYGYSISDIPVPKPNIKIKKDQINGIIKSYLNGSSKKAQFFRTHGLKFVEDSLEIAGPTYTHADYFFDENREQDYSMRNPIYLVYKCQCVLKKSKEQAITLTFLIDTQTGKLIGGDYYPFDIREYGK